MSSDVPISEQISAVQTAHQSFAIHDLTAERPLCRALNAAIATLRKVESGEYAKEAVDIWKSAQALNTRLP